MPWDIGMDYDKSRWDTVAKNLKKQGYEVLGDDGEYLYWRKWKGIFRKKTSPPSMKQIRKELE